MSDLFLVQRIWDETKIASFFLLDKEIINAIPLSFIPSEDRLIWHYEKSRAYLVRSGYRMALKEKLVDWGSSTDQFSRWWRNLWKLVIPPKIKCFIWKILHNAFPTSENLVNKNIPIQLGCKLRECLVLLLECTKFKTLLNN